MKKYILCFSFIWIIPSVCFSKVIDIPINNPREYDFKDKEYIFHVRQDILNHYPILGEKVYDYNTSPVFKQIVENKPWWGLDGINCYGNGEIAISGSSEESRSIDNPFVLIPVEEGGAIHLIDSPEKCPLTYPKPLSLTFDDVNNMFVVKYDVSGYYKTIRNLALEHGIADPHLDLVLSGKNAVDLGYPYAFASILRNVKFVNANNLESGVYRFKDFMHLGGSCGYPGGCNNGSPYQPALQFKIQKTPATMIIKLWQEKPLSPEDKADLIYQINLY